MTRPVEGWRRIQIRFALNRVKRGLQRLLFRVKGRLKRVRRRRDYVPWELIGYEWYGDVHCDRVPRWVMKEMARLKRKYSWHELAHSDRYILLRGRHYEYRITPAGQGGPITYIERRIRLRRRHRKHRRHEAKK